MDAEVMPDRIFELSHRARYTTSNVLLGERGERSSDLVEPRRGCRGETLGLGHWSELNSNRYVY